MREFHKGRIFFLFAFALAGNGFCQESWTIQQCVNYGLEHNIPVRQAMLNSKMSKGMMQQATMDYLPSMNASISHDYRFGRAVDQFAGAFVNQQTQTNNFSLSSQLVLFGGFRLYNTRRQYTLDYQASLLDAEQVRNDVAMNIIASYLQVLYNSELLQQSKNLSASTRKQLERISQLVSGGAMPKGNQLEMEAQLAAQELNEVNAKNLLDLAYLDLAQAMNLDTLTQLKLNPPRTDNFAYTIMEISSEDIFSVAKTNQPAIKSAGMKVRSAGAGLAAARGFRSPSISLNAGLGSGYSSASRYVSGFESPDSSLFGYVSNIPVYYTPEQGNPIFSKTPFNRQLDENLNRFVGFSMSIPIFNGWQTQNSINRAKINYELARVNEEKAETDLRRKVQQAHADAKASLLRFHSATRNAGAQKEFFRYAEKNFEAGSMNALDFLNAKNNLEKADSDLLQARYEYIFKTRILDFYLGNPLTLD